MDPASSMETAAILAEERKAAEEAPGPMTPARMSALQRAQFLYSPIFEKPEEVKNNPFIFEKHELGPRKTDAEYGQVLM